MLSANKQYQEEEEEEEEKKQVIDMQNHWNILSYSSYHIRE